MDGEKWVSLENESDLNVNLEYKCKYKFKFVNVEDYFCLKMLHFRPEFGFTLKSNTTWTNVTLLYPLFFFFSCWLQGFCKSIRMSCTHLKADVCVCKQRSFDFYEWWDLIPADHLYCGSTHPIHLWQALALRHLTGVQSFS